MSATSQKVFIIDSFVCVCVCSLGGAGVLTSDVFLLCTSLESLTEPWARLAVQGAPRILLHPLLVRAWIVDTRQSPQLSLWVLGI